MHHFHDLRSCKFGKPAGPLRLVQIENLLLANLILCVLCDGQPATCSVAVHGTQSSQAQALLLYSHILAIESGEAILLLASWSLRLGVCLPLLPVWNECLFRLCLFFCLCDLLVYRLFEADVA